MRKMIFIFFELLLLVNLNANATISFPAKSDTIKKIISVNVFPAIPLIEKDRYGQYLNFDLVIKNNSSHSLDLNALQVSVIDKSGKLVLRKSLNENGQAPSIVLLGNTILRSGEIKSIFNPFYNFLPDLPIGVLKYEFFFNYADTHKQMQDNRDRLLMDYDQSFVVVVKPRSYVPKTSLYLPLKGKVIVWDGHDFYAHHRRYPLGLPKQIAKGITANSNRYAYDFITIADDGSVFKDTPFKKENWYSFGKPVYAPGTGRIVDVQNKVPDNFFTGRDLRSPDIPASLDPSGMGNHVIIDHGNGEFSVILHMEKGSVKFKIGERVIAGQQIGNVGFSGDAIFPHVHYTVMNGARERINEGIPSYFNAYKLYRGSKVINVKKGRIDSGDIVDSEK